MQAVQFNAYGPPRVLVVSDVPEPVPGAGEVRVRIRAAGVNPKDCLVRKGKFRWFTGRRFPMGCGHDFAGEVLELGPGVRDLAPGDAVFGMTNGWRGCTYAEQAVVAREALEPTPPGVSALEAAAIPLAAQTALQALRDIAGVAPGHRVCINGGSGGVGTFAVQMAKAFGAEVTAVCSFRNRDLVAGLGADRVVDYTREALRATAPGFDAYFDVFGNRSYPAVVGLLALGGVYVTTVPNGRNLLWQALTPWRRGRRSRLVVVRSRSADLRDIVRLMARGALVPVVDRVYPLAEAGRAHAYVETKRARGKVVLLV
jgi:NADPH:quinone reductase-like Zn-dependent oxidoreductase